MATLDRVGAIDLILTADCNLRCSYCYQNRKARRRMNRTTIAAAVDLLARSRRDDLHLSLIGGEPLLEFALFRFAVRRAEAAMGKEGRIRFHTITNGTLLDREKAAFLADHRIATQLSFDGVPAAQNLRARGTFGKLDRLLERLRNDQPGFFEEQLTVSITLTGANRHLLAESVRYFIDKGVANITVGPLLTHDPRFAARDVGMLDRQFARISRICRKHYERTGAVPFLPLRRRDGEEGGRFDRIAMCGVVSGESLAIDVDGQAHGCSAFCPSYQEFPPGQLFGRLAAMRLGHIRDPGLASRLRRYPRAVDRAGIFHDKQDKYSCYGRCGDCPYLVDCAVCPLAIAHFPGNTDPRRIPGVLCAINRVLGKYRARFPAQEDPIDWITGRAPLPEVARKVLAYASSR